MKVISLSALLPFLLVLLLGAAMTDTSTTASAAASGTALAGRTLDPGALPASATGVLPALQAELAQACPQLPVLWVAAEIQAESGWNPHAYSPTGAAGLLQLEPATWTAAGGGSGWTVADPPPADHPVWNPPAHFAVAIPWMCANLRAMTSYLANSSKTISPLDAMAVCHIAGCSRVTGSATGIPTAGEASCAATCAQQIRDYLATIHRWITTYAAPISSPGTDGTSNGTPAQPLSGASTGCTLPDPTGTGGCITPATAWMLTQVQTTFGHQSASCWDPHLQNPTSDHPKGKACDLTIGKAGTYPGPADVAHGWTIATWLQTNATALHVSYLIWQDHIWSPSKAAQGWRIYTGGGIYDIDTPTGGHYDHLHVSITE